MSKFIKKLHDNYQKVVLIYLALVLLGLLFMLLSKIFNCSIFIKELACGYTAFVVVIYMYIEYKIDKSQF